MKLGLLGDIHGNDLALQTALAAASSSGVEKLLVTGDLVGYYYAPLKVLEMLQPWDRHIVRGNHEDMLISARSDPAFMAQMEVRYGSGLRTAIEQLGAEQLDELCNLPHPLELMIDDCKVLLCSLSDAAYDWQNASSESWLRRAAAQSSARSALGDFRYDKSKPGVSP